MVSGPNFEYRNVIHTTFSTKIPLFRTNSGCLLGTKWQKWWIYKNVSRIMEIEHSAAIWNACFSDPQDEIDLACGVLLAWIWKLQYTAAVYIQHYIIQEAQFLSKFSLAPLYQINITSGPQKCHLKAWASSMYCLKSASSMYYLC